LTAFPWSQQGHLFGPISHAHQHRIAVVAFSTSSSLIFDFDDYVFPVDIRSAILDLPYTGGSTYLQPAFELISSIRDSSRGFRNGKLAVIYTMNDVALDSASDLEFAIDVLRLQGDEVFAVGVSDQVSFAQLLSTVSAPASDRVFPRSSYSEVSKASFVDIVLDLLCVAPVQPFMVRPSTATTTTTTTTTTTLDPCSNADFVFVLDSSSTFTISEWNSTRDFVLRVIEVLPFDSRSSVFICC
jgi:hypothetical protein